MFTGQGRKKAQTESVPVFVDYILHYCHYAMGVVYLSLTTKLLGLDAEVLDQPRFPTCL